MADQNSVVPHNQELMDAISTAERFLMSDEDHDDPLLDNFVIDLVQDPSDHNAARNYGTDFSGTRLEENISNENKNHNDFPLNYAFGNPKQIPIWPVPPSPYSCTCCQSLREFLHVNGTHALKLDVHGRLGLISHAVLDRYNMPSTNHEYHMFDFCHESIESVKQFLVQYCDDRKREGYILLQDPLSNFYDALCIGLGGQGSPDDDVSLQQTSRGDMHSNQGDGLNQPEDNGNGVRLTKSYVASQRERTGKMKVKDLAGYFHLPINAAAKEINICPSAIKGICRREGLLRWPHRKIKSIESKILKKQQRLNSNDADERAHALAEIQQLQQRLAKLYAGNVG